MDEKKGHRSGSPLGLVRQEAELAPRADDGRFQAMADESPVILWESDANGDNKFANQAFRDFFGVTFGEVEGRGWQPLLHPEDAPGHVERFFKAVREHAAFSNEARHRRKDGEWRWLVVQARPRYARTGAFLGHVGVCVDVTERKRAEELLRESEERYRSLFEHMSDGLAYCRMLFEGERPVDFVFLDVNPAFEAVSGLKKVVGKKVSEIVPGFRDSDPGILERYGRVARLGAPDRFETWVKSVGQWFDISAYSHSPGTFVAVFDNITERKRAEDARREQDRRCRWLFEKSLDAVYVTRHSDGRILDANPAACALHGMSADEIRERGRAGLVVADDQLAEGLVRRALHGEGRTELNLLRKDGTTFPAEVASIIVGPDGSEFSAFVIARDISERKRAEATLRGTLQRFHGLLSSMDNPVLLITADGRVEFVNSSLCRALGLKESPDDLVGLDSSVMMGKLRDSGVYADEELARIEEVMRLGHPVKGEEVALQGGRTYLRDFVPLRVDGEPAGRLWVHFDITERKRAEEALREEDRHKAEFLAVLSHELRNPLAPIRNSIYLLERRASGSKQATHAKEVIRRQTEHLTRLVDDLLDVTRVSRGKIVLKRARVDLRDIVRRTADDLRSVFAQGGVDLHVDDSGPAWIIADQTRITQVLGNLLQNAVKFTPAGGSATVTLATKGDHAELRVRDTGVGMEPGRIEHMFAPFVQAEMTLARTKGGLGLGLPLVKGLVELHGGTVEARSDGVGCGSEFLVRLPLAETRPPAHEEPHIAAGAERREVLVIEDNMDAGETLAEILELQGHHVRVARDGRSGLDLAKKQHPDVVLCDIGLPDIDGYEVARTLRRDEDLRGTRLVAVSGYAQPEDRKMARDAGFDAHIAKPADLDELMNVLANDG